MYPFKIIQPASIAQAIDLVATTPGAKFIGGGTNLVDLMKMNIEQPPVLIDIHQLDLQKIESLPGGGWRIGALVKNSDLAYHAGIQKAFPFLSEAILAGASGQLRNMASTAGNILQRTRCAYFYDVVAPCNKRSPGSGCSAIYGYNRMHALLGTSEQCIATHPSDMCVALAALDARIQTAGSKGTRTIAFKDFHLLPGNTPQQEHLLEPGELVTHVEIPSLAFAKKSHYLKIRDRASYEFALVAAAVALDTRGGIVRDARIALGGVGTKPWRCYAAEQILKGKAANTESFTTAATAALSEARAQKDNHYKIELAQRAIVAACEKIMGG